MKTSRLPECKRLSDRAAVLIGSGLYSGLSPIAPGTAGSAVGLFLWFLAGAGASFLWAAVILLTVVLGTIAADRAVRLDASPDPSWVVIDEVAGMWVCLFVSPPASIGWAAASFALFRIFDVVKPWPVGRLERLPGGVGVMADDLAAGLMAGVVIAVAVLVAG